jgi:hypothetical protein
MGGFGLLLITMARPLDLFKLCRSQVPRCPVGDSTASWVKSHPPLSLSSPIPYPSSGSSLGRRHSSQTACLHWTTLPSPQGPVTCSPDQCHSHVSCLPAFSVLWPHGWCSQLCASFPPLCSTRGGLGVVWLSVYTPAHPQHRKVLHRWVEEPEGAGHWFPNQKTSWQFAGLTERPQVLSAVAASGTQYYCFL